VVDAMSDVTTVERDAVKPPPDLAEAGSAGSMASGIALVEQRMITILDVDRVFPTPNDSHDSDLAA